MQLVLGEGRHPAFFSNSHLGKLSHFNTPVCWALCLPSMLQLLFFMTCIGRYFPLCRDEGDGGLSTFSLKE